ISHIILLSYVFFFQAEDGIRDFHVTGVQTCALPIYGLWDVVRDLVAEGTTVLLTTQYLEEADQLADSIAVIDAGRVIASGAPSEIGRASCRERVKIRVVIVE